MFQHPFDGIMRYSRPALYLILLLTLFLASANPAQAFDSIGKNRSYLGNKRFSLLFGFGGASMIGERGIQSDGPGFSGRFGMGYSFTRRIRLDLVLQLDQLYLTSPNPVAAGTVNTDFFMISEIFRMVYSYDEYWLIPYLFGGVGFYQAAGVSSSTALSFNPAVQVPFGMGFETYIHKKRISIGLEYMFHVIFDEEQQQGVLDLLNVDEVSFNVQTLLLQLNLHFF